MVRLALVREGAEGVGEESSARGAEAVNVGWRGGSSGPLFSVAEVIFARLDSGTGKATAGPVSKWQKRRQGRSSATHG